MEEHKANSLLEQTVIQQGLKIGKLEELYQSFVLKDIEDKFEMKVLITQAVQDGLTPYLDELKKVQEKVQDLELKEYTRSLHEDSEKGYKGIYKELLFPVLKAIIFALATIAIAKIYGLKI